MKTLNLKQINQNLSVKERVRLLAFYTVQDQENPGSHKYSIGLLSSGLLKRDAHEYLFYFGLIEAVKLSNIDLEIIYLKISALRKQLIMYGSSILISLTADSISKEVNSLNSSNKTTEEKIVSSLSRLQCIRIEGDILKFDDDFGPHLQNTIQELKSLYADALGIKSGIELIERVYFSDEIMVSRKYWYITTIEDTMRGIADYHNSIMENVLEYFHLGEESNKVTFVNALNYYLDLIIEPDIEAKNIFLSTVMEMAIMDSGYKPKVNVIEERD